MPVDYKKDQEENKEFDEAVDSVSPEGKYQKPSLENLKEGVKIRKGQTYDPFGADYIGPSNIGQAGAAAAPWDYALGAFAAAPLVKGSIAKWGMDKTLEVGINALFPDVEDSLLEQGLRAAKLGTAAKVSKFTRGAYDKIMTEVFDLRIPNPFEVPTLFETG